MQSVSALLPSLLRYLLALSQQGLEYSDSIAYGSIRNSVRIFKTVSIQTPGGSSALFSGCYKLGVKDLRLCVEGRQSGNIGVKRTDSLLLRNTWSRLPLRRQQPPHFLCLQCQVEARPPPPCPSLSAARCPLSLTIQLLRLEQHKTECPSGLLPLPES
jgi:hypothetical protein